MTTTGPIMISSLVALTFGIVAYFMGARLTQRFRFLSAYSIPEPVTGGLVAALLALLAYEASGREIIYDLAARDALLVYFFTTIGLNARLGDLRRGGGVLLLMLVLTIGFLIVQAAVGLGSAMLFGKPLAAGVMLGTASLMGGHGTAIAWGPTISETYGVAGGAELGVAMATVGLIVASLLGGPIAKFLIARKNLVPDVSVDEPLATAAVPEAVGTMGDDVTHVSLMRSVLWINVAILMGFALDEALAAAGVMLPLFVPCLLSGIVLSNTLPRVARGLVWPAGTRAMSVISEFSLSVFLSMSLMSMALWTLLGSAHVLLLTVLMQSIAACLFIVFVIFPAMGGNYFAAVMSAGSTGLMLGATPTAIANMNAVTQRYGPSPLAFIVLPLVSAFFVDIANAVVIQGYLRFFG